MDQWSIDTYDLWISTNIIIMIEYNIINSMIGPIIMDIQ